MTFKEYSDVVVGQILQGGCVAIITANTSEFEAVLEKLQPLSGLEYCIQCNIEKISCFVGQLGLAPICLTKLKNQGSVKQKGSLNVIRTLHKFINIKCAISIGNCFSMGNPVELGDVVISKRIIPYESCLVRDGDFSIAESISVGNKFINIFDSLEDNAIEYNFKILKGDFLSGEKLIDDKSFKESLKGKYPNALAGEMEGIGVASACRSLGIEWGLIKAVADNGDGHKNRTEDKKKVLAGNAVLIAVDSLNRLGSVKNNFGIEIIRDYFQEVVKAEGRSPVPYYNLRGEDVVQLKYPKSNFHPTSFQNNKNKIHFEYYLIDEPMDSGIGFLFFGKDITISKTVKQFINDCELPKVSLQVCSPRVVGTGGDDSFRIQTIEREFERSKLLNINGNPISYKFLGDYLSSLWSKDSHEEKSELHTAKYFVDQPLYQLESGEEKFLSDHSVTYFLSILSEEGMNRNPIYAVVGEAGVGKSTLCKVLVNKLSIQKKKRAIYLSNEGGGWPSPDGKIDSIKSLYAYFTNKLEFKDKFIDYDSLELNLCCGNILIVVDGIDEIDSALGDLFDFELFTDSIIDLYKSFNECTIVFAARDFYVPNIERRNEIKIQKLKGFEELTVNKYFFKRFKDPIAPLDQSQCIAEATQILREISPQGPYNPFYADLAAEIVDRSGAAGYQLEKYRGPYLNIDSKIDQFVFKLLSREITKQSLSADIDELFEMLIFVCIDSGGSVEKHEMKEYIYYSFPGCHTGGDDVNSYLVSPFLYSGNHQYFFKYDCLIPFIKSRFLIRQFSSEVTNDSRFNSLLSSMAYGNSPLLEELRQYKIIDSQKGLSIARSFYTNLIKIFDDVGNPNKDIGKVFSGFFYMCMALSNASSKTERSKLIVNICGTRITHFYIYNDFFPLDFRLFTVIGGKITNYHNLSKSFFPEDKHAFETVEISFDKYVKIRIKGSAFSNCHLNDVAKAMLEDSEIKEGRKFDELKSDCKSIFKALYNSGRFLNKSRNHIKGKMGHPKSRYSLDNLLDLLLKNKILSKSKDDIYIVSTDFRDDIMKFLTESNMSKHLEKILLSYK